MTGAGTERAWDRLPGALKLHGALFAVAVVAALLTWTRDEPDAGEAGLATAWERDTLDVAAVHYAGPGKELLVERRSDEEGDFFWAMEVETELTAESDEADSLPGAPAAELRADTLQYPVGIPGHTLVARLARLRVIRDLGPLSPEEEARFGLDQADERIAVRFVDEERVLVVGDSAFGGSDRYALDGVTGQGYVIANDVPNPLFVGEGAIRERWLHRFADADVGSVRIALPGGQARTMARSEAGEWVPVQGDGAAEGAAGAEAAPDAAFANFMQRVDQLAIGGYGAEPDPDGTRPLVRADFLDHDGEPLGFVELFRDAAAERDPYYIRSETTRIAAYAVTSLAERVEQGLGDIF